MGITLAHRREDIEREAHAVAGSRLLIGSCSSSFRPASTYDRVANLGWEAVAFVAVLIVLIRPVATLVGTLGTPLSRGEARPVAWMMPRGDRRRLHRVRLRASLVDQGVADAHKLVLRF